MYEVVTNAAGNSWMFENRMKHVVDGDYTPHSAVDIFVKDLRLVTETALSLGFPLPLASTAYTMFANASNAGKPCTQKMRRLTLHAPYSAAATTQPKKNSITSCLPVATPHSRPAARNPLYKP